MAGPQENGRIGLMIGLNEVFEEYRRREKRDVSQAEFATLLGWSTATVSLLLSGKYNSSDKEGKIRQAAQRLLGEDYSASDITEGDWTPISVRKDVIIATPDFTDTYSLCNALLDDNESLTASIGLVTGAAGRGKTTAARKFVADHPYNTIYILNMGYTRATLFRAIAEELLGRSYSTYWKNLNLILEATRISRKVIVIDEADRMPLSLLEDLRTLNESGRVPILLVGEPLLTSTVRRADRIESRIRKPRIEFRPLDYLSLAALYQEACGLSLSKDVAKALVKISNADFRVAANDMQAIVKLMNVNHYKVLDQKVLDEYVKRG